MAVDYSPYDPELRSSGWGTKLKNFITAVQGHINALIAGTLIDDAAIAEAKLDISNAPADAQALCYNATSAKMEWKTAPSSADTGEVRMNAGDPMEYIDAKLGAGLENDGSDNMRISESYMKKFLL